jgi:hypothetical protein
MFDAGRGSHDLDCFVATDWRDHERAGVSVRPFPVGGLADAEVTRQVLALLGWDGRVVVEARAWSTRRLVACELDQDEHERRVARGLVPVTDPLVLRCAGACDPGFLTARPPVRIAGAIAIRRTWRSAVANVGGFSAFGSRVAVLPPGPAARQDVALEAAVEGLGVIAWEDGGQARLVHHPAPSPAGARTWVHRLVEEIVYNEVLAARGGDGQPVVWAAQLRK